MVFLVIGIHVTTFTGFSQLLFVTSCLAESLLRSTSSSCHQHVYNKTLWSRLIPLYKHTCLHRISLTLQPQGNEIWNGSAVRQNNMKRTDVYCRVLFLLRISARHDVSVFEGPGLSWCLCGGFDLLFYAHDCAAAAHSGPLAVACSLHVPGPALPWPNGLAGSFTLRNAISSSSICIHTRDLDRWYRLYSCFSCFFVWY